MSVEIITDSASDILPDEAEKIGITVLPLTVMIDGVSYRDGIDIGHHEFFDKMAASKELPHTSLVTPGQYCAAFDAAEARGNEVVCITLSSGLSGCAQSASIAAAGREKVHVIDSLTGCFGQRILVEYALRLRSEGKSAVEIAEEVLVKRLKAKLFFIVGTLENLRKGGRIGSAAAIVGGILQLKPILTVTEEGSVAAAGKTRGMKSAMKLLTELIMKAGIDRTMPYAIAYTGSDDRAAREYAAESIGLWHEMSEHPRIVSIGAAIGTHIGPGAVGAAFFTP